jgi:hypothetical protein
MKMIAIRIQAYALTVEIECSESYPDALTDVANRASTAFATALELMRISEIPIYNPDLDPEEE